MNTINLKIEKRWLSLQEGFTWNNIPSLAVVTGINGAGKTHLMNLLNSADQRNGPGKMPFMNLANPMSTRNATIVSSTNNEPAKLILPQPSNVNSLDQLIAYFKNTENRLAQSKLLNDNIQQIEQNITTYENNLKSEIGNDMKLNLEDNIKSSNIQILEIKVNISNLFVYAYEAELKKIGEKLKIKYSDLTEKLIIDEANPIFNDLSDETDFAAYIKQKEEFDNLKRIKYSKKREFDKSQALEDEPKIHERINDLFKMFDFNYFVMNDPYPIDGTRNGGIQFTGKGGEIVDYGGLSSGEQMIVKFIIWAMGEDIRGDRINAMILDEPDAHLHPGMCKMMMEILQEISAPKDKNNNGIRVIITTHSPSTVAFSPEESIFVLEKDESGNRTIRASNKKEAITILSEGIFTFESAIEPIKIIKKTEKNNIVCVEGKTDVIHINKAMEKLDRSLDIEVINLYNAATVAEFVKSVPNNLLEGKKIIGLFDNDDEGRQKSKISGNARNGFTQLTALQCNGKAYVCVLPVPNSNLDKYCPIEFLYPKEVLESNSVLKKREYPEFKNLYKNATYDEDIQLSKEFKMESTLRPFKTNDSEKNQFSKKVNELNKDDFKGFIPLFDLLERIVKD